MSTENVNVNVSEKGESSLPTVAEESVVNPDDAESSPASTESSTNDPGDKIDLLTVPVNDDNTALNVLVGFLGIAQRRGVFAINESAKIYECIQQFQKGSQVPSSV